MAEAERRPRNWPANGRVGGCGLLVAGGLVAGCRLQVGWRGRLWLQAVAAPEVFWPDLATRLMGWNAPENGRGGVGSHFVMA